MDEYQNDIINVFPGYEFRYNPDTKKPENLYRGTNLGFGGYVYQKEGMYTNVAMVDIQSMHPHSILAMNYFGEYTKRYEDLLNARILIKNGKLEEAKNLFDGKLAKYLDDPEQADQLAQALKIALNSCYGLTSASFQNAFRDSRNKNNIVALRGALFMRTLQDEIKKHGSEIIHIRTDSAKIPNATPEVIKFCMEFAKQYGYDFDHEASYERMCLVDKTNYVARYMTAEQCEKLYGYVPKDNRKHGGKWTVTGASFAHPVVFKTLFSKEPIIFDDYCETKEVQSKMYLDYNEKLPDVSAYEDELRKLTKKADSANSDRIAELEKIIESGHDYKFIGKNGLFTPVISGVGGAELVADYRGKFSAVTGTKGYRWLESEYVKQNYDESIVDISYYRKLIDDAVASISKHCDFNWFVSDDSTPSADFPPNENDVPWLMPCKDPSKTVCEECEHFNDCKFLHGEIA